MKMAEVRASGGNLQIKRAPVLSDFAKKFVKHVEERTKAGQLDPDTENCYRNGWRLLSGTRIAGMRIDQITTSDAAVLKFPGSPSNGNMALRTLRRILSYACDVGILRGAPKIKLLEEHGRTALIDSWVENILLELAPQYLADTLVIMLDSGLRPEEVMRIRWENVFFDRNVILVPYGKSYRSKRFVGMTDRMRNRIRVIQQGSEGPWVFPSPDSITGHRVTVTKAWGLTIKAARLLARKRELGVIPEGIVLYSARHTFATNFLANGGDLAKLMKLLGHSSITTTQKYLHPSVADAAEVMNRHNRNKGLQIVKSA